MIIKKKTARSLWQYYRDEPNATLSDSESFKSNLKITGNTHNNGNGKDLKMAVPLKYLSNFWRTLQMSLINCEVNLFQLGPQIVSVSLNLEQQNLQ